MNKYEFIKKGEKVLCDNEVVTVMSDLFDCYGFYNEGTERFEPRPVSEDTDDNDIYVEVQYRHIEGNLCQGTTVDELRITDVRANELIEIATISELSEDELRKLFHSIRRPGSIYTDDYANDCGVTPSEMCDAWESYESWCSEQGVDAHTEQNFIEYFCNEY